MTAEPRKDSVVTKTGDKGDTGLLYGGRVPKDDLRVEAYGTVDEAVSALGLARALSDKPRIKDVLLKVQKELFLVAGELATHQDDYRKLEEHFMTLTPKMVADLEQIVDNLEAEIGVPKTFLVPGATPAGAALDLGRTIVRRAERRVVTLQRQGMLHNPEVLRYLNRLSDLVYELARYENKGSGPEVPISGRKSKG
ncbi:MAG: cob(I)yrinic acid a,c-diamide adenosyltransferase [Chloroflexi bacterium]|nr:cob(I)yrinic acid a,c-diamide adenosyltransferase [Chloroflexota bacterium]